MVKNWPTNLHFPIFFEDFSRKLSTVSYFRPRNGRISNFFDFEKNFCLCPLKIDPKSFPYLSALNPSIPHPLAPKAACNAIRECPLSHQINFEPALKAPHKMSSATHTIYFLLSNCIALIRIHGRRRLFWNARAHNTNSFGV